MRVEYQSRETWLADRHKGIGGSEAAIVMGKNPWKSPYQLWSEKTGLTEPDTQDSEILRFGRTMEPYIADEYARITGRTLLHEGDYTVFMHPAHPFMRATHDRIIANGPRGPGVLSIKTAGPMKAGAWEHGAPEHYMIQLQHELAVSGCAWGGFAVLIWGKPLMWFDVERDEALIERIYMEEMRFWDRVCTGDPPPVDGSLSTTQTLSMSRVDGGSKALSEAAIEWHDKFVAAQARKEEAEEELRLAKNNLIAMIGDATEATLPNGAVYTYKVVEKKAYTVKASSTRYLRLKQEGE